MFFRNFKPNKAWRYYLNNIFLILSFAFLVHITTIEGLDHSPQNKELFTVMLLAGTFLAVCSQAKNFFSK